MFAGAFCSMFNNVNKPRARFSFQRYFFAFIVVQCQCHWNEIFQIFKLRMTVKWLPLLRLGYRSLFRLCHISKNSPFTRISRFLRFLAPVIWIIALLFLPLLISSKPLGHYNAWSWISCFMVLNPLHFQKLTYRQWPYSRIPLSPFVRWKFGWVRVSTFGRVFLPPQYYHILWATKSWWNCMGEVCSWLQGHDHQKSDFDHPAEFIPYIGTLALRSPRNSTHKRN